MKAKDRISAYICTSACGAHKVPLAVIGSAKNPRCFMRRKPPALYFNQPKAWSDMVIFRRWYQEVFLPEILRRTNKPVILLMDDCTGHGELPVPRGQVTVATLPRNCTARHQPMDQGIIAAFKLRYRSALLAQRVAMLETREQLRAAAAARRPKMPAGTMGLAEGHEPHMLDAIEFGMEAWAAVSEETIARCWLRAGILPPALQAELADNHGKAARMPVLDPAFEQLGQMLRSLCIHGQQQPAGQLEREQGDVAEAILALQSGDAAVQCRRWEQLEEEDDVVEAPRADLCDELVADVLPGAGQHTAVESGGEEEKFDVEEVAGAEGEAGCAAACGATDRQFDQLPPFSGDLAAAWELMAETAARTRTGGYCTVVSKPGSRTTAKSAKQLHYYLPR
ncbi:unnamed protein product [Phaeothamnion confervicola]